MAHQLSLLLKMKFQNHIAKRTRISIWIAVSLLLATTWFTASACTTFVLREGGELLFGRNLDWHSGSGLIMVNPRGLTKVALVDPDEKPAKWTARFGSVTFNQVGRDLPYGGINEAGLVVEHMSLDETEYPAKDDRIAISACQWIQFQLDNYSTVKDVIESDAFLRIVDRVSRFHFLVCDQSGQVAAIEFLGGKMLIHTGKQLPVEALANSTYAQSLDRGLDPNAIKVNRSLYNFATAARMVAECSQDATASRVDYAFRTLQSVSQGLMTKWTIVYDVKNLKVYVKVFETPTLIGEHKIFLKEPGSAGIKIIEVTELDFDGSMAAKVFDMESDKNGVINGQFESYTTARNRESIAKAFGFLQAMGLLKEVSETDLDALARYPESFIPIDLH